jgi:nucleoside-diphosphate-sugar epimerase
MSRCRSTTRTTCETPTSSLKHAGVDAVINLAGVLGTAETIGEEYEAAHVNILGALNVFDVFRNVPIVQIATGHEGQPNPYAITKSCITGLALSRAQWMGQQIAVVRAYHVYGPGQKMCAPHGHSKVRKSSRRSSLERSPTCRSRSTATAGR